MAPAMRGIDHVHIYVGNWPEAEQWYLRILGFTRVEELSVWAVDGGPLTLKNKDGTVHVALFESEDTPPSSTIAFGATGEQFLIWMEHLREQELEFRPADHTLAWSIYFSDPFGNYHEITTYEHALVAKSKIPLAII